MEAGRGALLDVGIEALDIPASTQVTLWDKQSLSHVLWVKKGEERGEEGGAGRRRLKWG